MQHPKIACVSLKRFVPCPAEQAITGERVFRETCSRVAQELAGSLLRGALACLSTGDGFFSQLEGKLL